MKILWETQVRRTLRCRQTEIRVDAGDGEQDDVSKAGGGGMSTGWIVVLLLSANAAGIAAYAYYK